jgi:hypothetical protein
MDRLQNVKLGVFTIYRYIFLTPKSFEERRVAILLFLKIWR